MLKTNQFKEDVSIFINQESTHANSEEFIIVADNIFSHLSDDIIIDDARLSAPHHPPLKYQVSLKQQND